MRVIVYGMGAVGGVIAAALVQSGVEVVGIARGAMLEAVRADGLRLRSVAADLRVLVPVVAHPDEINFRDDDAILLTMKTQDTLAAVQALAEAGVVDQPVFCVQNGVENERLASRWFANVHGATIMMPATYLVPGEVAVFGTPKMGFFDLGRYPEGQDAADAALAAAFERAGLAGFPCDDVMASKRGKLLLNLRNIVQAALGQGAEQGGLGELAIAEAKGVYDAAGLTWRAVDGTDPRRDALLKMGEVPGVPRSGGSTLQSLSRGTGRLETAYLNGEIAALGQIYGVPTPINRALTRVSEDLVRAGAAPGSMDLAALQAALGV